ncbi:hypothetical protein SLA2020_354940 [Shorea laevis]
MDKHIEMSYCCFESFKVLAKNYLDIEAHSLFGDISRLLEETNMTPADIAENLMPKSEKDDPDTCLKNLIEALSKEEARKKAKEEACLKAEKEKARLEAEKEEKEKEEALLKAQKEEKEKEEALQKGKKEEQEKEEACQKVEKERKVKSNLLKRLLKKMNHQSKK